MRDMMSELDMVVAFPPKAAVTDGTAQVSAVLDRRGYGAAMLVLALGTLTDADAVWSVLIEDSPDGTTFTAVDDAYLNGTELLAGFTFAADAGCRKIGYVGNQRYLRATVDDTTANTGNLFMAGIWLLGEPSREPTANPPTLAPYV
ncbi:MAG: hypothetical protein QOH47_817 [Sphingomonadales bacterium]|jgi:hypothetical protein|nr:hypothetical protein [Sphingomonadales bacterium]